MLATGSLRFCGCPLMTVPHSPADHAQPAPKGKRREVVVAGKRVKTVDVHAHCCVPKAMAVIGHPLEAPGLLMDGSAQGPDQLATRIAAMDAQGIDVEALSINPYWYKAGKDQSAELIRIQNETLVEFCAANPERFVAYATAALQHPELAAEQVEHAVKKLGFRGVSVGGSVAGEELANPRFHPFWKKCEELDVLVFLHPTGTRELEASGRLAGSGLLSNTIGNPLETTIALSHLIFEGTLDKFPGLKVIAAHGGGYLPSYADRSDHACMVGPRGCNADVKLKKKPTLEGSFDKNLEALHKKKIISDASAEAAVFQRKLTRDNADKDLADLKKAGMEVTEFSAAEQAKLRAQVEDEVLEEIVDPNLPPDVKRKQVQQKVDEKLRAAGNLPAEDDKAAAGLTAQTDTAKVYAQREVDSLPIAVARTNPVYPRSLQQRGIEGTVTVSFLVDAGGNVQNVRLIKATDRLFADAAVSAIKHWRFQPGLKNGRPVATTLELPVNFHLNSGGTMAPKAAVMTPATVPVVQPAVAKLPVADTAQAAPRRTESLKAFSLRGLDVVPVAIRQVAPVYPVDLKRAGVAGRATIAFVVDGQHTAFPQAYAMHTEKDGPIKLFTSLREARKWTEHILHAPQPVDAPQQAETAQPPAGQTAWTDPDRQGLMLRGNRQREVTVRSLDAA